MSYKASVISSTFRPVSDEDLSLIESLCERHMGDYVDSVFIEQVSSAKEGAFFMIGPSFASVGDSFAERLQAWATAMAPHVLDPFRMTLTNTDDPSDERQTFIWGGPTRESIEAFQTKCAVEAAKDELGAPGSASRQAMLDLLLADPCLKPSSQLLEQPPEPVMTADQQSQVAMAVFDVLVAHRHIAKDAVGVTWPLLLMCLGDLKDQAAQEQPVPEIFVVVSNNAVSEVFSTHAIKARVIDTCTDEVLDGVYELPLPPGRHVSTPVLVTGIDVQVAPDYCAQINAACDAQDVPRGRNSPSSRN